MSKLIALLILFFSPFCLFSQTSNDYSISFSNAVHHEANISVTFPSLNDKTLEVRMSRTSPGRYAIHDFAKNVYDLKAFDKEGKELKITRQSPQQWNVGDHKGFVKLTYKLFANRADGTYSQIDESHAHLNIPATFLYAKSYEYRPVNIVFDLKSQPLWKVATQLSQQENGSYYAPNLQYFMDSPVEISDHVLKEYKIESKGKTKTIRLAIHQERENEGLVDEYFEWIKRIVKQEELVFGELPDFDFDTYTFLACYRGNASGDGMEHRNSTILTSSSGLNVGNGMNQIGTVSHEFFHAWNVERIRPASLEPFSFEDANMSGELWFAEGFTSYYTSLILCRSGIISEKDYVDGLAGELNYVWNSPARAYYNPIEMSHKAPFVDAASSIDPTNNSNTFISYYSYGSVLGLALDLSLRKMPGNLNLDDFMKQVWQKYGKNEIGYTVNDLKAELIDYAGNNLGNNFFDQYIFNSQMPDYKALFRSVGVDFQLKNPGLKTLGISLKDYEGGVKVTGNPQKGSAGYEAGLTTNDVIIKVDGESVASTEELQNEISQVGKINTVTITFLRFGKERTAEVKLKTDITMQTSLFEDKKVNFSKEVANRRKKWLEAKE